MEWFESRELIIACLTLSVARIYLEVIQFDFAKLPLTSFMPEDMQKKFHRFGFVISVLYFLTFSPEILLS